jgi:hypothetical protein
LFGPGTGPSFGTSGVDSVDLPTIGDVPMAEQRDELVKATFLLPKSCVDELVKMAEAEGSTENDVLVKAITTLKLLEEEERKGATILVQGPDRKFQRILLR